MATTSIWSVKGWLGKVVIYVENPDKTENPACFEKHDMNDKEIQGLSDVIDYAVNTQKTISGSEGLIIMQHYVSGINCDPSTARNEMMAAKIRYGKDSGVMAYHGYQSFAPDEATPDIAHEIGIQLAKRLWGERFQVVVATHLDKENHLHNHFVVNSVSFVDGLRYHRTEKDYYDMQVTSDNICREYSLSVIENPKRGKSKQYGEWRADKEGKPTWRNLIKIDIDKAIAESVTDRQFFYHLRKQGYEIKTGKDISVKPPGKERFFRLARNFGEDYTLDGICRQILSHSYHKHPLSMPEQRLTVFRLLGNIKETKKISGLRGLYLHYCYLLGILPKNKTPSKRLHFLYREDLRKMHTISKETRLLCVHRINTLEQLSSYRESLKTEIEKLTKDRKHLRSKSRNNSHSTKLAEIKAEISAISLQLSGLRKEVILCDGITARSAEIKEKIHRANEDDNLRRKEVNSYEHIRRGR